MQTAGVDKQRYTEDKPQDCNYCYFWNDKRNCCTKTECYYLRSEREPDCNGCPYGKHSPCIGYCLQKIMLYMKQKKQGIRKEGGHLAG